MRSPSPTAWPASTPSFSCPPAEVNPRRVAIHCMLGARLSCRRASKAAVEQRTCVADDHPHEVAFFCLSAQAMSSRWKCSATIGSRLSMNLMRANRIASSSVLKKPSLRRASSCSASLSLSWTCTVFVVGLLGYNRVLPHWEVGSCIYAPTTSIAISAQRHSRCGS
jgi:hypothetical protein